MGRASVLADDVHQLGKLLFSEHQSDWKWNISSVTKSIISFAKQVWADAADHVRPGCSDPLTCLLTFLTLNAAIVVVIVLEGKSRVKGTIELFPQYLSELPFSYWLSQGF